MRALEVADRWAARDAPNHVNHCSGGRLRITFSHDLPAGILGTANGWVPDGLGGWRWDHAKCEATIRAGLDPRARVRDDRARADAFRDRAGA